MNHTKYFGVNVVQWRVSFFALEPVVRVVARVCYLRVEFRHHFCVRERPDAYSTFHQERLCISILKDKRVSEIKAFR